ncbi:zinc metalloproteinase nas 4 [Trichuris trichiura]|uniref:Metalloendopeptidase n=1 Tax=Trichuris trichiura TaxID=36087 RepID=A0A077YYB9_TRITR|nr:zinc metalloproteinase nas 4 [Trichuris trichiura]
MKALRRMVEYTLKLSFLLLILSAAFCEEPPEEDEAADDHENGFDWFWPHGVIPYEIIDTKSNDTSEVIETAMALMQNETCVRFTRLNKSSSYSHYLSIHVTDGIVCDATVGRQKNGVSTVWLHRKRCLQVGMILHQLMHVIGFHHENERPDRDFFVTVYWNNIRPEKRHLFRTRSWREFPVTTPYDYESITHLGSTAFSRAGRVTLEPLRAAWIMGQRTKLSDGDILKVELSDGSAVRVLFAKNEDAFKRMRLKEIFFISIFLLSGAIGWLVPNYRENTRPGVALASNQWMWPNRTVPYMPMFKNEEFAGILHKAMKAIERETCVRFVPCDKKNISECLLIYATEEIVCQSTVGRQYPKKSFMLLNLRECKIGGLLQHELLHTLGFQHEHSRPDRDTFIIINWENVRENAAQNFEKYPWTLYPVNTPYDYGSIMHYSEYSFNKYGGRRTLTTFKEAARKMGQRVSMSPWDIAKARPH